MAIANEPERYLLSVVKSHMATDFQLEVVVDDETLGIGDSVLIEAHQLVSEIEDEITEYREISPVWEINNSPVMTWIAASEHLLFLLRVSERLQRDSAGYFNPFSKSVGAAHFSDLEVDEKGKRIRSKNENLRLGFGAIGKGYALDAVRPIFDRQGLNHYRLSSGGSSWIFSGLDPNLQAWKIGWSWRRDDDGDYAGRLLRVPQGESIAIGVSGILEQGNHFLHQGKPIEKPIQSSFYAGRSAAEADAFSTALFVGAGIEGEGILTKLESALRIPALAFVDLEEQMIYNRSFSQRFLSAPS
ncbi:MAG: FAD:protein FMN transferase [Cryobacterium sp.]|nr:FAD:protein FMN transferase [Oligoflexia bacterium]